MRQCNHASVIFPGKVATTEGAGQYGLRTRFEVREAFTPSRRHRTDARRNRTRLTPLSTTQLPDEFRFCRIRCRSRSMRFTLRLARKTAVIRIGFTSGRYNTRNEYSGHASERSKQPMEFSIDSVGKINAIPRETAPNFKEIVMRLIGNIVSAHQRFWPASNAALRFSISARDSSAVKNSRRSNCPNARSIT